MRRIAKLTDLICGFILGVIGVLIAYFLADFLPHKEEDC
jgi:membrane-associated phospholipid phosphatase